MFGVQGGAVLPALEEGVSELEYRALNGDRAKDGLQALTRLMRVSEGDLLWGLRERS